MDNPQSGRTIQFQFNGKSGEYFKIWIVNIMLSIITLGIYSPWAKVRTKRYFYGNTTLDGSSFEYLGDPLAILKGRMIVFAFILVYALTTQYIPLLEFAFIIIYLIGLPWMVIKSLQFNARNSAYRNIRFNFDGRLGEAAFIFIFLSFISILTLGLAIPYVIKRMKQFTVENSAFGTSQFEFHATTGAFYRIYLLPMLIPLIGILAAIAIPAYQGYINAARTQQNPQHQVEQTETKSHDLSYEEHELKQQIETCMHAAEPEKCAEQDIKRESGAAASAGIAAVLIVYLLMGLIWVYVHTRSINLVLNSTTLNVHNLQSKIRVRNMFYIYLTNILGVLFSLGLLIPWASIRLARYRLTNTALIANGDINNFIADQQQEVSATGGEFTEAFDIDLGF